MNASPFWGDGGAFTERPEPNEGEPDHATTDRGAPMTAPAVDLYHRANGQGLTYHSTTNHSVMNDALAHIDRLAGAWREAGYDVTWNGTGLIVATNDDDELRGLILFRDNDHHHLATAAAVEHVARHRNPVAALASLRAATRKDTTR